MPWLPFLFPGIILPGFINYCFINNEYQCVTDIKIVIIMSKENKSIHEFDINLICEYFSGLDRQGPGSTENTLKALSFIPLLSQDAQIADLGCGTGAPTMMLAQNCPGQITGIDLFPEFIEQFNKNASHHQLEDRVKGVTGSMDKLPFRDESLDLIWSEGAIYNIGFVRGLQYWRRFLKNEGYIAVSEASWFTKDRPDEINDFWNEAYPEIDTIPNKVAQMQNAGFIPVASFIIPENCWTENFYVPQLKNQERFLRKHAGNKIAEEFVANEKREAALYAKYKSYYGYVFYIGKKIK